VRPDWKNKTVVTLVRNLLKSGRSDNLITAGEDIDLQLSFGIGTLTQVDRQCISVFWKDPQPNTSAGPSEYYQLAWLRFLPRRSKVATSLVSGSLQASYYLLATALILKKKFAAALLFRLILAVEAVAYIRVGFNLICIEHTIITDNRRSVAGIHLVQMPFSHSIVTSLIHGAWVGLFIPWRASTTASAMALAIAVGSISQQATRQIVKAKSVIQLRKLQQTTVRT
jgi:hypothetical protein